MQTTVKMRPPQGLIADEISTTGVAQPDRFEWWRAQFRPLNEVQIEPDHRADFRAAARTWRLGPILFTHCDAVARQVVRTPADCSRDGVDDWNIRIGADASVTSRTAGGSLRVRPGLATLGTFGTEYCDSYDAGEWLGVIFPRSIAPSIHADTAGRCVEPLTGAPGLALAGYLLSLAKLLPSAAPHDLPRLADMTRAMLVAALSGPRSPNVDPADHLTMVRVRVEQVILANIGSARLDANRIAGLANVSRSTLYRAFEAKGGVAGYVMDMRLDRICGDIGTAGSSRESIAQVAARYGLHNAASFSRAFRRRFGCTPTEFREAARASCGHGLCDEVGLGRHLA